MSQSSPWFVSSGGQQHGPISDQEVQALLARGALKPNDLVWRDGFPEWRPAAVVFAVQQPPGAIVPPPLTLANGSDPQIQTVQLSAKKFKAIQLVGFVVFFPALMTACVSSDKVGSVVTPISGVVGLVGFLLIVYGKIMAWWHHG